MTRTARYGVGVLAIVIAIALRYALDPFLGEVLPLIFFFLPVVLAAWYGGLGPGLLTTALSLLLGDFLFVTPRYSILRYDIPHDQISLLLVGLYGATVSLLADKLRKSVKAEIESKERYRAFIENSSEAIWRYELEQPVPVTLSEDEQIEMLFRYGYLAECNDATAKLYGYDRADQIVGTRIGDLLIRSDPRNIAFLRAFRRSGYRLSDVETREVDRHGNTKYFLNNMVAIEEHGVIARAWGTQRDITDQKRIEVALRESEERLKRITDATQDALWEIDLKTNKLWWSEGARALFGRSPAELSIGLEDWYNGIHPEDVDRVRAKFDKFMESGNPDWSDEYRFLRADGSYVYIFDRGRTFYDESGTPTRIAGAMDDITERKRAEDALRESEERFAKAFQASPDCIVITRLSDKVILEVNDCWTKLFGHEREEVIGKTWDLFDLMGNSADRGRAQHILKENNRIRDFEMTVKRKSGEIRSVTISGEWLELRGDLCFLTIVHDITERKEIEEEREQLLRQEKAARESAEEASRMKDEFLATISHELRTPLTSILGWAHILAEGSLSEPQARHAAKVIAKSAQSQTRLIDDILDTSRIITGRLKLDVQSVEIERVFQATVDVIRPSAELKGVALDAVIESTGDVVFGDASRLQQAIWNLLSNAVKFTNEGGRIEARLARVGHHIEIAVSDTGIGIERRFLPYLFQRFRQADSANTRKYGGLGLGLAITRHIVELHGGGVSASSPGAGRGATFRIKIPLASSSRPSASAESAQLESRQARTEAPQTKAREAAGARQRLDGVRVLLVEDDPDTLEVLKYIFDDSGAEVITATSASEGLEALERLRPDTLISDIAMPDQDGYELIRRVRSREAERGGKIPAVAVTAYAATEDRIRALNAGFHMYVAKPIDPDELIAMVASLTGHIC
jgi:PAS domain S-box-containing protein